MPTKAKNGLGIDIGGVDDIDPTLNFVDGPTAAAQSVMTDLLHAPGLLWWSPSRGIDLRKHLHKPFDKEDVERDVIQVAHQDERVESATCVASEVVNGTQRGISVSVNLVFINNGGDADFTLSIDEAGAVINASVD